MKEEVINRLSEEEKELLSNNRWAIRDLAKIEEIFINNCLQQYTYNFMLKYIDGLYEANCIDELDYYFLKDLAKIINDSRIYYFELTKDYDVFQAQEARKNRIYMKDYFVKEENIIPTKEYDAKLRKVYENVMKYK